MKENKNTSLRYIFRNYFSPGECFFRYQAGTGSKGTVILIHGWGIRAFAMTRMAVFLQRQGYHVLNYDYPTSKRSIREHAAIFLHLYRKEHLSGKLHFITHSMGGLVLRRALAAMTADERQRISSIVMLGPPNRGSKLAYFSKLPLFHIFNRSLGDMIPGNRELAIPIPDGGLPPIGIIAGTNDGKVSYHSTALPNRLSFDRITVKCDHPGLRDPLKTGRYILRYLRYTTFQR
ncbi:MAG: alpha/beta fold hydrolase [Lentisphaeria bacterium]|nr:alpha/beta fold hydrolase [Lentisphaeria bacterium]